MRIVGRVPPLQKSASHVGWFGRKFGDRSGRFPRLIAWSAILSELLLPLGHPSFEIRGRFGRDANALRTESGTELTPFVPPAVVGQLLPDALEPRLELGREGLPVTLTLKFPFLDRLHQAILDEMANAIHARFLNDAWFGSTVSSQTLANGI